ncbi:MAG: hypothetical protein IPJ87_08950 [Flavobacteriales bacterium]|nr:hypothetical protein [Flavobacteriales bacterium]MBK7941989.1 hypothetical protein [Flavobacteriales bacterium]MBK8947790.1 hypothetical protein [Flavobacteriales bacterium]MBK9700534.1 hypothetical protein [Flavobacteriales bacterium]
MIRPFLRIAVPLLMALALVVFPGSIHAADRLLAELHMDSGQLPAAEEEVGHAGAVTLLTNGPLDFSHRRIVALLGHQAVEQLTEGIRRIHVPPPKNG